MNDTQKTIVVKAVTAIKKNKKQQPFISVMDEADTWWYVGDAKLFDLFKKGKAVECRVNRDNDFQRIVDVMDGDAVEMVRETMSPGKKNAQLDRIESYLADIHIEIIEKIEEVRKMINPL